MSTQHDKKLNITKKIFPYGTHIYRKPSLPIDGLKKDMRVIKKLGFNMVKIQESWALDEQQEGKINLFEVEELISEAEKLDLVVYFGVTMEQAPAWLWKKYPDCHLIYNTGEPHNDPTQSLLPADGKPGPCWDNPDVKKTAGRFIKELVGRIGKYKNIIVWNVWQEVGFWPMYPGKLGFCYCPYTLERFRNWLKGKYGVIEKLNATWQTGYGKWEEVEPPRMYTSVPSWIDWRYYMDDIYLAEVIKLKVEAFKKNDHEKRPVFCHVGSPTIGSGKDWRYAKEVDFFGCSCYPAWGPFGEWDYGKPKMGEMITREISLKAEMENSISLRFDYIRSSCKRKDCWAAEFQGGPVVTYLHKGRTPTPEDIRRWVLTALSCGITGLSFWNHRSEISWQEAYGFGLLDSIGDTSVRVEEAGRIGKAINRYPDLFSMGKLQQAEVAIFINEDLWHFSEGTAETSKHLTHTIRGIYKALWEAGIWVDFVEASEIERLKKYKVLILPFPLAISEELMGQLKDYVAGGGVLISEACPGRYDRYGFARSGELTSFARELFGVEQKNLTLCHEPGQPHWTPIERSYGEIMPSIRFFGTGLLKGHSILANFYVETFSLKGAMPILTHGKEITGVVNPYEKGKAYLIGTFIGHAVATYEDKATQSFLLRIVTDNGVKQEKCGELIRRRRILNNKEAWFLINPTPKTVSEDIDFRDFAKVEDIFEGEIDKNTPVSVPSFSVKVIICNVLSIMLGKNWTTIQGEIR